MRRHLLPALLALAALAAALPRTALAHGFGQRYDLPVPLWLYLFGAAAAVLLCYLLIQGQLIVPLLSDPLGRGWDHFGTADRTIWVGIISARTAWYVQIGAIIAGHVAAVYLAHVVALRHFGDARRALRSQLPMLLLMLLYTMSSLWTLAQPTVNEKRGMAPLHTSQVDRPRSAVRDAATVGIPINGTLSRDSDGCSALHRRRAMRVGVGLTQET